MTAFQEGGPCMVSIIFCFSCCSNVFIHLGVGDIDLQLMMPGGCFQFKQHTTTKTQRRPLSLVSGSTHSELVLGSALPSARHQFKLLLLPVWLIALKVPS